MDGSWPAHAIKSVRRENSTKPSTSAGSDRKTRSVREHAFWARLNAWGRAATQRGERRRILLALAAFNCAPAAMNDRACAAVARRCVDCSAVSPTTMNLPDPRSFPGVERAARCGDLDVPDEPRSVRWRAIARGGTRAATMNRVGLTPGYAVRPASFAMHLAVATRIGRARGSARSHEAVGRIRMHVRSRGRAGGGGFLASRCTSSDHLSQRSIGFTGFQRDRASRLNALASANLSRRIASLTGHSQIGTTRRAFIIDCGHRHSEAQPTET